MTKNPMRCLAAILLFSTATMAQAADEAPGLRFVGSNTIGAKLVPDIAQQYLAGAGYNVGNWETGASEQNRMVKASQQGMPDLSVTVDAVGSGEAFKAFAAGKADIGMSSRPVNEKELAAVKEATGTDLTAAGNEHVMALDGLAIITSKANPRLSLSIADIAKIFSGKITNWSEIGGQDMAINVYARGDKSGTFDTFKSLVLGKEPLAGTAKRFESSSDLSDAVAADQAGIGFVSLASVRGAKAINVGSSCGLSYSATEFQVQTEDYPLARRLFLYTLQGSANAEVGKFVNFALSSSAAGTVKKDGFVSLEPAIGGPEYTGARLLDVWRAAPEQPNSRYAETLIKYGIAVRNAQRLSTTFRFKKSQVALDARGDRDIDRLVSFMDTATGRNYKLNVIGFTDNEGSSGRNIVLSRQRAESIATAVRKRAAERGVELAMDKVIGLGPVAPVNCNATPEEREKNRRVEIWLTRSGPDAQISAR